MKMRIIPEAFKLTEDLERHLDKIEADPKFRAMMRVSDREIREGRTISHEKVVRMSRALRDRKPKRRT